MTVTLGAYLVVIPDARDGPSAPLVVAPDACKDPRLPFVVIPDARSAIRNRSPRSDPVLNRFRVPLTLRVSGPGMTSCVDARAISRVLQQSSFRTRAARSGIGHRGRIAALNQVRVPSADAAYQQRPFELAEVLVGSGSFWPVLPMLRLPHLSSACGPCGVAVAT